mmetsp:Transcript_3487/g.4634  ORF Transcript_3487/g.4634 Transcript_3487/m.4634 type:complete len:158 (+) Transcript_3487:62-535(+)
MKSFKLSRFVSTILYLSSGPKSVTSQLEESLEMYPQDALSCYATTAPQKEIICPQDRMTYCVKEFMNSSRRECGSTREFPNDVWDVKEPGGLCVYRKCSATCQNETRSFIGRDGLINSRTSVCCEKTLCNDGFSYERGKAVILFQICVLVAILIIEL